MYLLEFWIFSLPRSQHFICVIQGYGSLLTLPCILADGKSSVIHKPAQLKRLRQLASLTPGGSKAKLVRFHTEGYPVDLHVFLIFNVLLDYPQWI